MKPEKLLLYVIVGLLALVCAKFPVWGIIHLERKFDTYPIISHATIATIDEMSGTLADFDEACQIYQAGERDAFNFNGTESYNEEFEFKDPEDLIDSAVDDMYAAVDRRKALAARADWSLVKSMMIGGQAYTHATWLCAPPYADFATQINVGFTPTYDPAS